MTLPELQAKLATHSPRLLSCKEAGMSEGPWTVKDDDKLRSAVASEAKRMHDGNPHVCNTFCGGRIDWHGMDGDARFIAATNGEKPWAELLWNCYGVVSGVVELYTEETGHSPSSSAEIRPDLQILLALSAANRLGWVDKKEGE